MYRLDKYWIGILIGLLLPALFGLIYVERMNLWPALEQFQWRSNPMLSNLLLVSIFPDMALLFLFYKTDTWKLSKGVLYGAIPYLLAAFSIVVL